MYLPAAIRYGIQFDVFMRLNPRIMSIYQQSYIDKVKEERDLSNYNAWLHNQYTIMAVGNALNGKKCKYPKKPYEFKDGDKEIPETEENYELAMQSMIDKMNRGL